MYQNLDIDSALHEYRRLISSKLPQPRSWDSNAYDNRTGSMGRESSDPGYRSVIFYIQLSKKIVPEILREFFTTTERYLIDNYGSNAKFHMMFLNKEDGKPLHPGKPCLGRSNAMTYTTGIFAQYAGTHSAYAKKLNALFPQTDLYETAKYPSKDDLCVLVTDEGDVELAEGIREEALRKPNRFIQIMVLPGDRFDVFRWSADNVKKRGVFREEESPACNNGFEKGHEYCLELDQSTITSFGYIPPAHVSFHIDSSGAAFCCLLKDDEPLSEFQAAIRRMNEMQAKRFHVPGWKIPEEPTKVTAGLGRKIKSAVCFLLEAEAKQVLYAECKRTYSSTPSHASINLYRDDLRIFHFYHESAALGVDNDNITKIFALIDDANREF